jgi:hypothetical protein
MPTKRKPIQQHNFEISDSKITPKTYNQEIITFVS